MSGVLEQSPEPLAKEHLVLGDHYPHGSSVVSVVPAPWLLSMRSAPPHAATRSERPLRPEPGRGAAPPTPSSATETTSLPFSRPAAGKRRSGRTRKGTKWLSIALTEAAQANTRSRDTYLSAQYRRLRARRGHKKAIGAVKHSIIVACWHMLTTGELYNDAGGDYFTRLDPDKQTRRLVAQLERLGHVVTLQPVAA